MKNWLAAFYTALISLLAGMQVSGQILGFARVYTLWTALPLTIILGGVFFLWMGKTASPWLTAILDAGEDSRHRIVNIAGYLTGAILILVLLLLPLILWPYSGINDELTWDAGLYHLPKAAELIVSHGAWDMTIDYGEYPWGYESLIAFSLLISPGGMLIGTVHALITLLFFLSFFFLAARFSQLPRGVLFFAIAFVVCSFDIIRAIESSPWWVFRVLTFTIGKNDFHLSAAILAVLVFAPFGRAGTVKQVALPALALSSALVLSTKPNGAPIVILALLLGLAQDLFGQERRPINLKALLARWLPAALVLAAGVLWALRNLILMGRLISQNALAIQQWSILNNLANPNFYRYMDGDFKILLFVLGITILAGLVTRRVHWTFLLTFLVCFFTFIATPASGFFGSNQVAAQIAWRFGASLVAFETVAGLLLIDPLIVWLNKRSTRISEILVSVGMIVITGFAVHTNASRIQPRAENAIVLRDQFRTSVGVDGYFSAYDYIQKNIRNSVIWVENGYPFYVFGPGLTNTVTRSRPADYRVFFKTAFINEGGYPDSLSSDQWNSNWTLVYEDSEGRVYHRK